jgi:broad specificity phosphatase PhoE
MIYLVRHGQTEWNVKRIIQGKMDIPLNEVGREQASIIKSELDKEPIDLIICSPLKRAKETAEIINEGRNIPIIFDDRISERNFGEFEGKVIKVVDGHHFWDYYINEQFMEAESIQEFFKRVYSFLDDITIKYSNKNILLVSHGGVSIAVYCYYNNSIPEGSLIQAGFALGNCEVISYNNKGNII